MNKRFIMFAGNAFYANAAWRNYRGDFDSPEAAAMKGAALVDESISDWWQVVDLDTRSIVMWGGSLYGDGPGPAERTT